LITSFVMIVLRAQHGGPRQGFSADVHGGSGGKRKVPRARGCRNCWLEARLKDEAREPDHRKGALPQRNRSSDELESPRFKRKKRKKAGSKKWEGGTRNSGPYTSTYR